MCRMLSKLAVSIDDDDPQSQAVPLTPSEDVTAAPRRGHRAATVTDWPMARPRRGLISADAGRQAGHDRAGRRGPTAAAAASLLQAGKQRQRDEANFQSLARCPGASGIGPEEEREDCFESRIQQSPKST